MRSSFVALFGAILVGASPTRSAVADPVAVIKNGTYVGVHSATYDQDFFLGIPYAKPSTGDLRFRIPQSLNTTWTGVRSAKEYSAEVRLNSVYLCNSVINVLSSVMATL